MGIMILAIVLASSVVIAVDSHFNQIATNNDPYNWNNGWPAWLAGCLLLWIFFAPWYLMRRSSIMRRREDEESALTPPPPPLQWAYCSACKGGNYADATTCMWCGSPLPRPDAGPGMGVAPPLQ